MNTKKLAKDIGVGATKTLLIALFVGGMLVAPNGVAAAIQIFKLDEAFEGKEFPDYEEIKLQRALRYLKSRKLIDIEKQYRKEVFKLTKLGWFRARKLVKSFGIPKPKKWDGKWRIVIFDIPEYKKSTREVFRNQLRALGFANVQKSIWVHPYECRDQLYYLAGNMFIKPYVRYITAEDITGEKDLRQRFSLE